MNRFYRLSLAVLASKQLGASTIPVRVQDTYTGEVDAHFWQWARYRGYAFLRDVDGTDRVPTDWESLTDDPLRDFVARAARKYEFHREHDRSIGARYPLWIKLDKGVPFIEFKIADALRTQGFKWQYGMEENVDLFQDKIELARQLLQDVNLEGLLLVKDGSKPFDRSQEIQDILDRAPRT